MRIAYVAPYQGPSLCNARPIVGNLSLAGSTKIELIAKLLGEKQHEVEVISQGEVVDRRFRWYPPLVEQTPFDSAVPIFYASALPIRFVNGLWSSYRTLELFKARHRKAPYDLVIVYNLKQPQVACAYHAIDCLHLPVVLEYEDDAFVDVRGKTELPRLGVSRGHNAVGLLSKFSGCMAASPYLLSRIPSEIPRLLLRGVIGEDLMRASEQLKHEKRNWVLFSGTHYRSKGIKQLIVAWQRLRMAGWELHITGYGELTEALQKMAAGDSSIVFHGLVSRNELVKLMCSAKVCINPHDLSETPGNVFAFKIIEYLAAGAHVLSTPMGELESDIERGVTYMRDNDPATIAATLRDVLSEWGTRDAQALQIGGLYGPHAIANRIDEFIQLVRR